MPSRTKIISIAAVAMFAVAGFAQLRRPFEVASVKPDTRDDGVIDEAPHRSGDRVTMRNAFLSSIVAWAYDLKNPNYELVPGTWGDQGLYDNYDIEALAPGSPGDSDLRLMFQSLLEERFGLKVHRETRDMAAYDLTVAHGGAKLMPAPPRENKITMGYGGSSCWVALVGNGGRRLTGKGASIEEMVVALTRQMHAPVRDRTDITGIFDFSVAFSSGVEGSDAPVLATAIHELGLNLEKSQGSFEVLVIDHLEKLSGN